VLPVDSSPEMQGIAYFDVSLSYASRELAPARTQLRYYLE